MFKVNKQDVNDAVLESLLLTMNIFHTFFYCSIADFELIKVYWIWSSIYDYLRRFLI